MAEPRALPDAELRWVPFISEDMFFEIGELFRTEREANSWLAVKLWRASRMFCAEVNRPLDEALPRRLDNEPVDNDAFEFLCNNVRDYVRRRQACLVPDRPDCDHVYLQEFEPDIMQLVSAENVQKHSHPRSKQILDISATLASFFGTYRLQIPSKILRW